MNSSTHEIGFQSLFHLASILLISTLDSPLGETDTCSQFSQMVSSTRTSSLVSGSMANWVDGLIVKIC